MSASSQPPSEKTNTYTPRSTKGMTKAERDREYKRRYRAKAAAKAKHAAYNRAWRAANLERARAQAKVRYYRDPATHKERCRRFSKNNLAYFRAKNAERKAWRLRATPPWLTDEQRREIADWYALAAAVGWTVDHVIPLRGKNVCGLHVPWNLQLLSQSENAAKGNRTYPGTLDERVIATAVRKDQNIYAAMDKRVP